MNYKLRPYQQQASDSAVEFMTADRDENGLVVIPTGGGKSLVIADTVSRLKGKSVVFQPSKEILQQNYNKLRAYGYHPAVFSASFNRRDVGDITLATIGSVKNHKSQFADVENVLVDEAHLVNAKGGMYADFFEATENCRVLGFTATPYRLTSDSFGGAMLKFLTRTRPRVFSKLVHVTQNNELFNDGFLCPLRYRQLNVIDESKIRVNTTGMDFDERSLAFYLDDINLSRTLLEVVESLVAEGRKHILVFTRFVKEAQELARQLKGFHVVSAETPAHVRDTLLRMFKAGQIRGIVNVGVLTLGFDFPDLDTVVLARPSMSLALYYQMVGRAIRIAANKSHALIVDMAGLVKKFGKVEDLLILPEGKTKWHVSSNGRQLTNVYLNQSVTSDDGVRHPLLPSLAWSEGKKEGDVSVFTAKANVAFWQVLRTKRQQLQASGVSYRRSGREASVFGSKRKATGDWIVEWRISLDLPTNSPADEEKSPF